MLITMPGSSPVQSSRLGKIAVVGPWQYQIDSNLFCPLRAHTRYSGLAYSILTYQYHLANNKFACKYICVLQGEICQVFSMSREALSWLAGSIINP